MKAIRFLEAVAGVNFAYRPGEVVTLDDDTANDFLRAKQAVEFDAADVEVAAVRAPEVAVVKRGRFRKTVGG